MAEQTRDTRQLIAEGWSGYHDLRLAEAMTAFQAAADMDAASYEAHLGLARTLTRMRRGERATAAARTCIELDPDRYEGHAALGVLHFLLDDLDDARTALARAVDLAPEAPEPRLTLAQVHADAHRYDDAQDELDQAQAQIDAREDEKEQKSLLALAYHAKTYCLLSEGKSAEAIESAQEVIALEEANPYAASLAYSNLGILEARARHYDVAIDYLERAFEMNRFFHRTGNALGRLLIIRGRSQQATEVLEQVLELNPDAGATTRYAYGLALAKCKRRPEALAQFRRALDDGLTGPDLLAARWQTIWLSDWGRRSIVAVALAAILVWVLVAKPSSRTLTFLAVAAVVLVLQKTVGRRRR